MNITPPSLVETEDIHTADINTMSTSYSPDMTPSKSARKPKWERRLPKNLTIAALSPSETSLYLKVQIETPDHCIRPVRALLDSGATGLFIDKEYVISNCILTCKLKEAIPVFNVDGTANEGGAIREVAELKMTYQDHEESALFAVTNLGKQNLLLGFP